MKIAMHAFDGISLFHLSVPTTIFAEVRHLGLDASWQTIVWSTDPRVTTSEGVTLDDLPGVSISSGLGPWWEGAASQRVDVRRLGRRSRSTCQRA